MTVMMIGMIANGDDGEGDDENRVMVRNIIIIATMRYHHHHQPASSPLSSALQLYHHRRIASLLHAAYTESCCLRLLCRLVTAVPTSLRAGDVSNRWLPLHPRRPSEGWILALTSSSARGIPTSIHQPDRFLHAEM